MYLLYQNGLGTCICFSVKLCQTCFNKLAASDMPSGMFVIVVFTPHMITSPLPNHWGSAF